MDVQLIDIRCSALDILHKLMTTDYPLFLREGSLNVLRIVVIINIIKSKFN
jgi:hypothetical protein